jgi:hypothetical protein
MLLIQNQKRVKPKDVSDVIEISIQPKSFRLSAGRTRTSHGFNKGPPMQVADYVLRPPAGVGVDMKPHVETVVLNECSKLTAAVSVDMDLQGNTRIEKAILHI